MGSPILSLKQDVLQTKECCHILKWKPYFEIKYALFKMRFEMKKTILKRNFLTMKRNWPLVLIQKILKHCTR